MVAQSSMVFSNMAVELVSRVACVPAVLARVVQRAREVDVLDMFA